MKNTEKDYVFRKYFESCLKFNSNMGSRIAEVPNRRSSFPHKGVKSSKESLRRWKARFMPFGEYRINCDWWEQTYFYLRQTSTMFWNKRPVDIFSRRELTSDDSDELNESLKREALAFFQKQK